MSAQASKIEINFPINPQDCYVVICDNGVGMSQYDLFDAMKYGSQIKKDVRDKDDLGRFGLGLKAASLSQCKKLTVISKCAGSKIAAFCWDLDLIKNSEDWDLIEYTEKEISDNKWASYLQDKESGTVVIWEEFGVLEKNAGSLYAELSKYQEITANYLSLIFHRYISKDALAISDLGSIYWKQMLDEAMENNLLGFKDISLLKVAIDIEKTGKLPSRLQTKAILKLRDKLVDSGIVINIG